MHFGVHFQVLKQPFLWIRLILKVPRDRQHRRDQVARPEEPVHERVVDPVKPDEDGDALDFQGIPLDEA